MRLRTTIAIACLIASGALYLGACSKDAEPELHVSTGSIELEAVEQVSYLIISDAPTDGGSFGSPEATLEYSLSTEAAWLGISPTSGTCRGEADSIRVQATSLPSYGVHETTIVISSNGGNRTVEVTLTVTTVPLNPEPADLAASTARSLDLTWNCQGADSFSVLFDTRYPPLEVVATGLTETSHSVAGLEYATTYYWRVIAHQGDGFTESSGVWRFSTVGGTMLTTPANGAVGVNQRPLFTWSGPEAESFDVFLDTVDPPVETLATAMADSSITTNLRSGTTYYWMVRAHLPGDVTADSEVWTFDTIAAYYILEGHGVATSAPSFIDVTFTITDQVGFGISDLVMDDFRVYEDGAPISTTESAMLIRKRDQIPYELRTVLMLDNSTSIGAGDLETIKAAAVAVVQDLDAEQEVAVFSFSDSPVLLQDFTTNVGDLTAAINSIAPGFPTTDLYGAVIAGVEQWEDSFDMPSVLQGFLVLLTDGSDTQGSHNLTEALEARGDKLVYAVGLGSEIDQSALEQLANPASGFYPVADVDDVVEKFIEIQERIATYANSFYWMNYLSPKRGVGTHELLVEFVGNTNPDTTATVESEFDSDDFFSVLTGIYVNLSAGRQDGLQTLDLPNGASEDLLATSVMGTVAPAYEWSTSNASIVDLFVDLANPAVARADIVGSVGQQATITVQDLANGFETTVAVTVGAGRSRSIMRVLGGR